MGPATPPVSDVVARVDGVEITGQGNEIEVNTGTLTAEIEFAEGFSGSVDPITISGGAMTFNFSPDLSRSTMLALPKINATALGGSAGRLSDLASGGSASLTSGNLAGAVGILDGARDQVLEARARAGAFEKYTIESSQAVLDGHGREHFLGHEQYLRYRRGRRNVPPGAGPNPHRRRHLNP